MKICIMFESFTGNTKHVAFSIQQILQQQDRSLQFCSVIIHQECNKQLTTYYSYPEADAYIIGTYLQNNTIPPYVHSYLSKFETSSPIMSFSTSASHFNLSSTQFSLLFDKCNYFRHLHFVYPHNQQLRNSFEVRGVSSAQFADLPLNLGRFQEFINLKAKPGRKMNVLLKTGKQLTLQINSCLQKQKQIQFKVSLECNACGKCTQNCPLNCIKIVNEIAVISDECEKCCGCFQICPQNAIYDTAGIIKYQYYFDSCQIGQNREFQGKAEMKMIQQQKIREAIENGKKE
ncbi:4Fe-4S_ferredoxin iron-sulfur binding domain protein [Hexamita inflata]|uniref:4Fe-4S ferredoxin iron-sulfur binding domain protein n=1 Tax=Hexamita inflata TaxID=28002 RepID=A0AA86QWX0_9EUKA|nr:4Fe-4S ferredoxin iron-sulfur binding domain protein [Hexamita inflata]